MLQQVPMHSHLVEAVDTTVEAEEHIMVVLAEADQVILNLAQ